MNETKVENAEQLLQLFKGDALMKRKNQFSELILKKKIHLQDIILSFP